MKIKDIIPSNYCFSAKSENLSEKKQKGFLWFLERFFYESAKNVTFPDRGDCFEGEEYSFSKKPVYLCVTASDFESDDAEVFLFKASKDFVAKAGSFTVNKGVLVVAPFVVIRSPSEHAYLYVSDKSGSAKQIGAFIDAQFGFFVPEFVVSDWKLTDRKQGWCFNLDATKESVEIRFSEEEEKGSDEESNDESVSAPGEKVELVDNLYDEIPVSLRFRVSDFIERDSVQFFERDETIHDGNEMLIVSRKMPAVVKNSIRGWGFAESEGDGKPSVAIFDANEGFKDLHSLMYTIDYKSLVTEDPFVIGVRSCDGRCSPDSYAVAIIMEELLETINILSPEINWRMSNYINIVSADLKMLVGEYKDLKRNMFNRWSKQLPMSFIIKTKLLLRCSFDVFYRAFDSFIDFIEKTDVKTSNIKTFFNVACETYQIITGVKLSEHTQISFRACKNPSLLNAGLIKEILEDGVVTRFLISPQNPMTDPVLSTLSKFFSPEYLDYIKILEKVVSQSIEELLL